MQNLSESEAIRQRMEEVRRELDEDVQAIVEGARDFSDWRAYVKDYPWLCLGAAAAVGYFIVPRRGIGLRPDPQTLAELTKQSCLLATSQLPPKDSARSTLLSFVGNLVLRGVVAYVGQQAGKLLATPTATPVANSPSDEQP